MPTPICFTLQSVKVKYLSKRICRIVHVRQIEHTPRLQYR